MTDLLDKYRREDMLADLQRETARFEWRGPVSEWICDCGCDNASWCQRVSGGMAFYQQAWGHGTEPSVWIFETREDVERFIAVLSKTGVATNPARFESVCAWLRSCWDSQAEA